MIKSIGIIGLGFVGSAVYAGMKHAFNVAGYDKVGGFQAHFHGKPLNCTSMKPELGCQEVLNSTDGPIFICVPTPMKENGACNISIVEDIICTLNGFNEGNDKRTVVIKSTVVPGTTQRLNEVCNNLHVCFNPEFLREVSAMDDFKNQDRIIVGGPRKGTSVLKKVYNKAYPDVPVTKTSSTIAEMVKYITNGFLATKVAFANEIAAVCDGLDIDYDKVIEYATKDERLGMSHWAVPGPDGKRGFGGSCFPKDINGLMQLANVLDIDCCTIDGAWKTNLNVRPERDWELLKGRAVTEVEA